MPRSGRSPGEGNGNPLQYSCLENPMDRGAGQVTVHGITKSEMLREGKAQEQLEAVGWYRGGEQQKGQQ